MNEPTTSPSLPPRRERLPPPLSNRPPTAPGSGLKDSGLLRLVGAWAGVLVYFGGLAVAAFLDEPWRSVGIVLATLLFAPVASIVQRWIRSDRDKEGEASFNELGGEAPVEETYDDEQRFIEDDVRPPRERSGPSWDGGPGF